MYDALIIEPNSLSRTNLKQVAHHGKMYGSVFTASSLKEALRQLEREDMRFDVVFFSGEFEQSDVQEFLERAKSSPCGNDTAYIAVIKGTENDSAAMANWLLGGVDGFLIEPYSERSVAETAKVAAKVKRKNAEARMAAASDIVVSSMMSAVDSRAEELVSGKKAKPFSKQLHTAAGQFKILAGTALDTFVDRLIEKTEKAAPRLLPNKYAGASKRVRQMEKEKKPLIDETTDEGKPETEIDS